MSKMGTQAAQNAKQLTGLQRVMQGVSRVFTAFALGATRVAAALLRTTAIVGSLAMRFTGLVAGVAGVTLLLFRMASAAALAAVKTAKLRREAQLSAKGKGTTAGNLDKVTKGLAIKGLNDGEWSEFVGSVSEKTNTALTDGETEKFDKEKLRLREPDGRRRDTSKTAADLALRYLDFVKAANAARKRADDAKGKPKSQKAAQQKAIKAEDAANKFASDWGISGKLKTVLEEFGSPEAFAKAFREANERNPVPTQDQEDRSKRIAENAAKLEQSIEALSQPFANLRDTIVDSVLPGLVALGDGLVWIGKKLGLISETAGEHDERRERGREINRAKGLSRFDTPATRAALDEAAKGGGSLMGWLFGSAADKARADLGAAASAYLRVKDIRTGQMGARSSSEQAQWDKHLAEKSAELAAAFDRLKAATAPAASAPAASGPPGFRSESAEAAAAELDKLAAGAGRVSEAIKAWQNIASPPRPRSESAEKAAAAFDNATAGVSRFSEALKALQAIASPTQGAKGLAEQTGDQIENDNRKYENIGNDQRTISPTVNINQTISGMEGAAAAAGAAAKSGVLGAISSKGANTSTGAINAP